MGRNQFLLAFIFRAQPDRKAYIFSPSLKTPTVHVGGEKSTFLHLMVKQKQLLQDKLQKKYVQF